MATTGTEAVLRFGRLRRPGRTSVSQACALKVACRQVRLRAFSTCPGLLAGVLLPAQRGSYAGETLGSTVHCRPGGLDKGWERIAREGGGSVEISHESRQAGNNS